jgi:vitamin B12 transporter
MAFRSFYLQLVFSSLALTAGLGFGAENAVVSGDVTDASGHTVPNTRVTLHQTSGSALLTAVSDMTGRYEVPGIAPGEYLVDAAAPGLALEKSIRILLEAGENRSVPIVLAVSATKTEVTVTAAGEPQPLDQVSKALDIVNAADAEQRGLFSISQALDFVPGLRVSTRGTPGSYSTIQTRGSRIQDTAILIDGFPFRDPTSPQDEASAYIGDLMLVDTSRIEVLRGSGSSLYGTNAMSGTVNILTGGGTGPAHGDIDLQGGGLGLFRGLAQVAGGAMQDRLSYSFGVSHLNVANGVDNWGAVRDWSGQFGLRVAITPKLRIGITGFANTGFLQETVTPSSLLPGTATGIVSAVPLPFSQMRLADANLPFNQGNANFLPSLGDPDAGRYSHYINSLLRLDHEVTARFSYQLAYGEVFTDRNNTDGPAGPITASYIPSQFNNSDRYKGRIDTVRAKVNYLLGSHHIITAGYEFSAEHYLNVTTDQNPDPAQHIYYRTADSQRFQSPFVQDEIRFFGGRLGVLLSVRYTGISLDQPTLIGGASPYSIVPLRSPAGAYTGDASIVYLLPGASTKLRGHVGNSFRAPSIYERFGGYFFGGQFFAIGDPRLSPERAVSLDFGVDQYLFRNRLKLSGTYFYSHLQNTIGFLSFPPDYVDPYGRSSGYYNVKGGLSRGVEVSGEFRPTHRTTMIASYTYTNAHDLVSEFYTGTAIDPLQVPRILPQSVKLIATQQLGRRVDLSMDFDGGSSYLFPLYGNAFTATTAFRFNGPRQLGVAGGYVFPLGERLQVRVYGRLSNALNQDYYEDGFRAPPRWAVGGIRFSF